MISIKLHSSRISPTILKSSPRFYFFNLNFDYLKFSMLSFTSQKPQLPIHSINKIMLNSSNFLLKCAPKPYPKVWFYQLVLGEGVQLKIFFPFLFFFSLGGNEPLSLVHDMFEAFNGIQTKKKIVGPLHIVMRKNYFPPNLSHV